MEDAADYGDWVYAAASATFHGHKGLDRNASAQRAGLVAIL